jgi:hypothetical protein
MTEPVFGVIQTEIDAQSYSILIGLLFDVYQEQNLQFSTLILSIHLLDQILSTCQVRKSSLLLLGAACLTLASKLEEIYVSIFNSLFYLTFLILFFLPLAGLCRLSDEDNEIFIYPRRVVCHGEKDFCQIEL